MNTAEDIAAALVRTEWAVFTKSPSLKAWVHRKTALLGVLDGCSSTLIHLQLMGELSKVNGVSVDEVREVLEWLVSVLYYVSPPANLPLDWNADEIP